MQVAIVRDALYTRHSNGDGHPERPERLQAIDAALQAAPFGNRLRDVAARDATAEELARVHDAAYIERIAETDGRSFSMLDADTGAAPESYRAALRAAGGAMSAVDSVFSGETTRAFALPRPPGHHAEANRAMGFCLFNNIAVAAKHAQAAYGVHRVAIIDWDVHHGNGTQWSFYEDPSVLYISLHQYPLFPGTGLVRQTGSGAGEGTTVNLPLPRRQRDEDYEIAFEEVLLPVLGEFAPELVLVSAGFDAHRDDPLAGMELSVESYRRMTRLLMRLAALHAHGRLVHVLEGGYHLEALGEGVSAVLEELSADGPAPGPAAGPGGAQPQRAAQPEHPASAAPSTRRGSNEGLYEVLSAGKRVFSKYWASLS